MRLTDSELLAAAAIVSVVLMLLRRKVDRNSSTRRLLEISERCMGFRYVCHAFGMNE